MNDQNASLKKEIEALLSKTIEANKVFVTESSGLLRQMGASKGDATKINIFQNEFLSKALTAYASLNIQHAKNMLDLGISLVQSVRATGSEGEPEPPGTDAPSGPAFVLSGTAAAGTLVGLSFIVDNHKKETVDCELVHGVYVEQQDPSNTRAFKTSFSPASFSLEPGGAQPVEIQVRSPKNTPPGSYLAQVQIKGFEPAFFSIQITIT